MNSNTLTVKSLTSSKTSRFGDMAIWAAFAVILIVAPLIFNKGASLSILSQIGTVMIFGLWARAMT